MKKIIKMLSVTIAFISFLSCSILSDGKKDGLGLLIGSGIDRTGKLTSTQKTAVIKEMTEFYEKVDEGCPCLVPEKETDPKYIIGKEEKAALDSYRNGIKADGLDRPDRKKKELSFCRINTSRRMRKSASLQSDI
ncbi:MAG: hypothetical protein MUD12_06805 [Spirochaetes bacterium]|jgi:hypothetical protein|nr:hypothetical protein [Spirochaetota bacterium]